MCVAIKTKDSKLRSTAISALFAIFAWKDPVEAKNETKTDTLVAPVKGYESKS